MWGLTDKATLKRRISVRLLKTGIRFFGKLYFDDISTGELNQLIYLLNSGESLDSEIENQRHGYKLGMGKPLGLGSVALHVDNVKIREMNPYAIKEYEKYTEPSFNKEIKEDFEKMTKFLTIPGNTVVSYPSADDHRKGADEKIFTWFSKNHSGYDKENGYKPTNMPNSRNQMFFKEYMEAMEVGLTKNQISKSHDGNGDKQSNSENKSKESISTQKGVKYITVTLTKVKPDDRDKSTLFGTFEGGNVFNVPMGTEIGTEIQVKVNNVKENGWKFCEFVTQK